jgi:hypothetical protein
MVAKKQLNLAEADYRAILLNHGGVESARDLDDPGFNAMMDRFRELGFVSTARKAGFGARDGMASPGQVAKIHALWKQWAADPSEANLNHFLEHRFGVSALRFLPATKTRAVITALNAMVKKKTAPHAN